MTEATNQMPEATIEPLPARLTSRGGDPALVGKELLWIIGDGIANQPRTLQKRIGPSEIGHPCTRRLGYKLLGAPTFNTRGGIPWKPFVGTCVHTGIEKIYARFNEQHPNDRRFYIEQKVGVAVLDGDVIDGSCDLYDRVTATVIDWKVVGPSMLKHYRASGPGDPYRPQAHLYGLGWRRRGLPVDTVMIMFLPRNGELSDAYPWYERYDESVATAALNRLHAIKSAVNAVGPAALAQLPTADAWCMRCPYHVTDSADPVYGCPGHPVTHRPSRPALTIG